MTFFWILVVLLSLLVTAAVLLPLWRAPRRNEQSLLVLNRRVYQERLAELEADREEGRIDADTFSDLQTDLQRNLLSLDEPGQNGSDIRSWRVPLVVATLASLVAVLFYGQVLLSSDVQTWWQVQKSAGPAAQRLIEGKLPPENENNTHSLQEIIQGLQYQLQRNPEQPEAWFTLGVAYAQAELLPPALTAFERAWRLRPDETRYALTFAQARLFSNQGQLDDLSRQLLTSVVQREPAHEGALLLLGLGAYRSGDHALAVSVLEQLQKVRGQRSSGDGSAAMQEVARTLADARLQLQAKADGTALAASTSRLTVSVQVDKSLAGKFSPNDVVYVFARALQGPPMPLAVVRKTAADLPLMVELDDSQSMMPDRPLSSVKEIVVEARISRHGSPEKQAGDLEAVAVPVRQSEQAQKVVLRINSVLP